MVCLMPPPLWSRLASSCSPSLTLMIGAGMNTAITNPLHRPVKKAILAADLLLGHDGFGSAWIADHRAETAAVEAASA